MILSRNKRLGTTEAAKKTLLIFIKFWGLKTLVLWYFRKLRNGYIRKVNKSQYGFVKRNFKEIRSFWKGGQICPPLVHTGLRQNDLNWPSHVYLGLNPQSNIGELLVNCILAPFVVFCLGSITTVYNISLLFIVFIVFYTQQSEVTLIMFCNL